MMDSSTPPYSWLHHQDSHLVRSEIFDFLLFGRDPLVVAAVQVRCNTICKAPSLRFRD
uniref:Uncharacterized protein n=1 Tax=Triticum urartu TaxID=4572 RepID=A0A8R7TXF0_TRIUA